jgi:mRNA interferase MazF
LNLSRGDLFRVYRASKNDPKDYRVFVIVSRKVVIDSRFSTVICAPVYSRYDGLTTQVQIGINEGLKNPSSIHCDELVSIHKSSLTHFVGSLNPAQRLELNRSLRIALELD